MFHRRVDELLHFGKRHDLVELAGDFLPLHAENRAAHEDVIATGQFRMKARAHFQEATKSAVDERTAFGGFRHPREDLKECALARAVGADDSKDFAFFDFKLHVA